MGACPGSRTGGISIGDARTALQKPCRSRSVPIPRAADRSGMVCSARGTPVTRRRGQVAQLVRASRRRPRGERSARRPLRDERLDTPVLLPHIRAGKVKALAVTSATRSGALPDVPTTGEGGFETVLSDNWYGLSAPAGVPADILDKLHKAATTALRSPELKKQFDSQDAVPAPTTPGEFAAFVKSEQAKWGPVVVATGAKLE